MERRDFFNAASMAGFWALTAQSSRAATGASSDPVSLQITGLAEAPGPPVINAVPGQNILFRITIVESIIGDLQGKLTERVTQMHPADNERSMPIATLWKIETAEGSLEGHYSGIFETFEDGRTVVFQSGEVLLVTRAYAHLYRAEVFYGANLSADKTAVDGWVSIRKR